MLTAEYVRGIVDGEGSFTVYVRDPHEIAERKRRVKVEPKFILKLQARDLTILEELKKFFGCGKIYSQPDARPKHQNCYRFEVFNRKELQEVIIPFFRKNPPRAPSKLKDFEAFAKIVDLLERKVHKTSDGVEKIWNLKCQMHRGSLDAGNPLVQWEHQS